ncbi:MAG: hypothetical protein A2X86_20410 [Bdellovibrionales bacterium GWA2_49_15]|nr:MAG: hypothetical protein A2X86_20410 [Bdellovibrionales bacterium GWA2_49_15]HAZ11322.1 hypothetical protein [Bdellovibrionales bacterium]
MNLRSFLFISCLCCCSSAFAWPIGSLTIGVDRASSPEKKWKDLSKNEEDRVRFLVETLLTSTTGKNLLGKARDRAANQGKTLFDVILPGEISITDSTLVRRFSPDRPEATAYELQSKIYINRELKVRDALLDLAHELVHFIYKTPFNPYQDEFQVKDFIVSTLEGRGGEIDAFLAECLVERELFPSRNRDNSNCVLILGEDGNPSRQKAVAEFYRVGAYLKMLQADLARYHLTSEQFPQMTDDHANFISSAYAVPYPLAALREFETIMGKVCENDYKRLSYMRESIGNPIGRGLASVLHSEDSDSASTTMAGLDKMEGKGARGREFVKMAQSYQRRCEFFQPQ